jgi:hypothetical protein
MSEFGKSIEVKEGGARAYYTGVSNFDVIAVNPTKEELGKIYGRDVDYDPEYTGTTNVSDAAGEREVNQIRVDFYLRNQDLDVNVKVAFYIADTFHKSSTGKLKVINDFGNTTWLSETDIKSGNAPDNMSWYNMSGVKVAKRGEEEVIDFLKNLLNLPIDITKLTDPAEAHARFPKDILAAMFKGDVSLLKKIVDSSNNKIGMLLGVKTKADGKIMQAAYTKKTLRQYVLSSTKADKFKYLQKDLADAKANGAYGNVDFGKEDFVFRKFVIVPTEISTENLPPEEDAFPLSEPEEEDWLN